MPYEAETDPFLDFHVVVNKVAGSEELGFITVVKEAPVSQWGYPFSRLGGEKSFLDLLERSTGAPPQLEGGRTLRLRWGEPETVGSPQGLRKITRVLFDALFPEGSGVYELLGRSCHLANQQGKVLRLKLELHAELSGLPWEVFRPPVTGSWALDISQATICVVRYLGEIHYWRDTAASTGGDRPCVLIVKADPEQFSNRTIGMSFMNESIRVQTCLNELADLVSVETIERSQETLRGSWSGTLQQLISRVNHLVDQGRSIVGLHFIGHGGFDEEGSFIYGEDKNGDPEKIGEDDLRVALDRVECLRWVIFNACSAGHEPVGCPLTGLATSMAVIKNVPTVLAYRHPVDTIMAENLAGEFYEHVLRRGRPPEEVIRNIQFRYSNPGGLVLLVRSVGGKMPPLLDEAPRQASSAPEGRPGPAGKGQAAGTAPATGQGRPPRPRETQSQAAQSQAAQSQAAQSQAPQSQAPQSQAAQSQAAQSQAAQSRPPRPQTRLPTAGDLGEMILIPAGPFQKGLTPEQLDHLLAQFRQHRLPLDLDSAREALLEEPFETVVLPDFYIDRTPVTNGQFARFVEAATYRTEAERKGSSRNWRSHNTPEKAEHPVVFVTHADAEAYCSWAGKRLPTADEWKKAHRGPDGRLYPWGDTFDKNLCNTAESQQGYQTTPVTQFPEGASVYGCLDMVGNVEEWTATLGKNGQRIVLGGSWCSTCQVYGLPVLQRLALPGFNSNEQGFRCARDAG